MTKKKPRETVPFYMNIDAGLRACMQRFKALNGVPESAQVELALRAWLFDEAGLVRIVHRTIHVTGIDGRIGPGVRDDPKPPRDPVKRTGKRRKAQKGGKTK